MIIESRVCEKTPKTQPSMSKTYPSLTAVFDEIDTLACSCQSVYPLKHREYIKAMPNLKNLSLYTEPDAPVREKPLRQSFPKLKITFHNYKM